MFIIIQASYGCTVLKQNLYEFFHV